MCHHFYLLLKDSVVKLVFYKKCDTNRADQQSVCAYIYVVFTCTHHSIWAEGIHPLLYQGLHVVLSEVFALLLLFEADET